MIDKHAYLVIAHNDFELLGVLLKMIDDERNDIYVHIDKKSKNYYVEKLKLNINKSKIIFFSEIDVKWAHSSQVACEMFLLEKAYLGNYAYYHLISGVDLPIKNQNYIHNFFSENNGKEFIHFEKAEISLSRKSRISYYHFFEFYTKLYPSSSLLHKIFDKLESFSLKLQKKYKIDRIKNKYMCFATGANWFSITNDLVSYILKNKKDILKGSKYSISGDEVFLQTLVRNSKFMENCYHTMEDNDYHGCMRYIDWEKGNPYVLQKQDFRDLVESEYLFARKFSTKKDRGIIELIYNHIMPCSNKNN